MSWKKTAAESSTIPKLTDEQVAEIQQKIEQESQVLEAQELQKNAQNKPLEVDSLSEQLNVTRTEKPLSADELAEQAEMDESLLTLESYYPPDDDLATPQSSESAQKSEANNVAS